MLESPEGERVVSYDDRFYREPTPEETQKMGPFAGCGSGRGISWDSQDWGDGKGYRAKVAYIPEGWTKVTVPSSENKTFAEWCKDYYGWESVKHGEEPDEDQNYGYVQLDPDGVVVKCIDRTNPQAKWDWFEMGGRWLGFFPLKEGATGKLGKPGLGVEKAEPGTADQVAVKDIDFEHARDEAEKKSRESFTKWREIYEKHGKPELSWSVTYNQIETEIKELEAKGIHEELIPHPDPKEEREVNREGLVRHTLRERYKEQPAIAAACGLRIWGCPVDEYGFDEEAYVQKCRNQILIPFAIVKDGKWYAKGDMGWWGSVSNEKDKNEWAQRVQRLYEDLSPDTLLTLVDCHI